MKLPWIPLFCATIFGLISSSLAAEDPSALNVMTFNLRYDNPADGSNAWPHRKDMAAKVFTDHEVDFSGLQEALVEQIADLQERLPEYGWIGVGRDDGKHAGEHSPIFYRKDKFELLTQGTFWLSETPEVPGKLGWDAACPRIATWGVFRRKADGKELFLINTHFDHQGIEARKNGAKLLIERIAKLRGSRPAILTGDFNSEEQDEAIKTLITAPKNPLTLASTLSRDQKRGADRTFNGFKTNGAPSIIDFILVGPGIQVDGYKYLPEIKEGVFISDHWPVLAQLKVP